MPFRDIHHQDPSYHQIHLGQPTRTVVDSQFPENLTTRVSYNKKLLVDTRKLKLIDVLECINNNLLSPSTEEISNVALTMKTD